MSKIAPQDCTCILESAVIECPVHMPALQRAAFDDYTHNPAIGGVVTMTTCPGCGAFCVAPCPFCAERRARQEAFRDVARRAREEIAAWLEAQADGHAYQGLEDYRELASEIRSGGYRDYSKVGGDE